MKMKGLQFNAEFKPRGGYVPTVEEVEKHMALCGNSVWYNPKLELIEKEVRSVSEKEVLIKIGACGVCGSDLHMMGADEANYVPFTGHCAAGTIIGHEYSGEIIAVGSKVKSVEVGDLVVAETMNWCGECDPCRSGMVNQCENLEELGFTRDGGFAEYMIAEEKYCFKVNELKNVYGSKESALEVAALIEPIAVAYTGMIVSAGGFRPGANVAVTGAGPVGLAAVAIAKTAGAAKVFAIDLFDNRLELAVKMGADVVLNSKTLADEGKTVAEVLMKETGDEGIMMHVEATGAYKFTLPEIQKSLAIGAKICQIGMGAGVAPIIPYSIMKNAATYGGYMGGSGNGTWKNIIRLISGKKLDPSPMISGRYSLENVIDAFDKAKNGAPGKIIVTPHWINKVQ